MKKTKQNTASRLKHRITIQEISNKKNTFGEVVGQVTDIQTVWAEIRPVTGKSFFSSKQINSEITHQITIRYTYVKPSHIIKFNDRKFEVLYVMNLNESNELLQIMAKELIKNE